MHLKHILSPKWFYCEALPVWVCKCLLYSISLFICIFLLIAFVFVIFLSLHLNCVFWLYLYLRQWDTLGSNPAPQVVLLLSSASVMFKSLFQSGCINICICFSFFSQHLYLYFFCVCICFLYFGCICIWDDEMHLDHILPPKWFYCEPLPVWPKLC